MTRKYYLTTAIDYSNGEPHLGHAYEKIGADCMARYRRLRGQHVHFVIGMDEHGLKVAQSAEEAGIAPQHWVDAVAAKFREAWAALHLSHDDFIRTTEPRHRRAVQTLWRRIGERGYVSQGTYGGYYCVGCEAYKDRQELADGRCPLHPTREVKWVEEPNYFFALGRFRDRLLAHYDACPDFVRPAPKFNEVRNVVAAWTDDYQLSVSRSRVRWGIPWPDDPQHIVYVWVDALINYLSATGFPEPGYEAIWPADVHVIGPDIVRFHAAIWPAMLMAADLPLPRQVWCHGWINSDDAQRFSKSAGVRVTLPDIIARHGADALRYFVLREVPWHGDGTFTWERFDARYTADLADGYGNLVSRVLAMITRYRDGVVPSHADETSLDRVGGELIAHYRDVMDRHLLHDGADAAWRLVDRANGFVEQCAPWRLAKEARHDELDACLGALARAIARITLLAAPYLPASAQRVWQGLGSPGRVTDRTWDALERPVVAGQRVEQLPPLFPKPRSSAVTA